MNSAESSQTILRMTVTVLRRVVTAVLGGGPIDSRSRSASVLLICALAVSLVLPTAAHAVIQTHTFSISGDNGETGSGQFTWDDDVVADGSPVANSLADTGAVLTLNIQISGGNVIGGSTTFTLADCVGAFLENAPDFGADINFVCNNAVNSLSGFSPYVNYMNDTDDQGVGVRPPALGPNSSTLTFTPGSTVPSLPSSHGGAPYSIPSTPLWALLVLGLILPLLARGRLN